MNKFHTTSIIFVGSSILYLIASEYIPWNLIFPPDPNIPSHMQIFDFSPLFVATVFLYYFLPAIVWSIICLLARQVKISILLTNTFIVLLFVSSVDYAQITSHSIVSPYEAILGVILLTLIQCVFVAVIVGLFSLFKFAIQKLCRTIGFNKS